MQNKNKIILRQDKHTHIGTLSTTSSSLSLTAVPPPPVTNFTKPQPASTCFDNGFCQPTSVVIHTA